MNKNIDSKGLLRAFIALMVVLSLVLSSLWVVNFFKGPNPQELSERHLVKNEYN
jgi:hypothetical protein